MVKALAQPARKYLILIIAVVILTYANSLFNGFIYDDFNVIVLNDFVKSFKNLPLLFSRQYLAYPDDYRLDLLPYGLHSGEMTYRPVATLSYFINYAMFGMQPFGYHLTNLAIHIANCILIYMLLNILFSRPLVSLFSALIFGIHPVNTEVLNCTGFRPNSLALLFLLSAIVLYLKFKSLSPKQNLYCSSEAASLYSRLRSNNKFAAKSRTIYLFTALFSYLLAVFSKEIAVLLPFAIMFCDYYQSDFDIKKTLANWRYYILFFGVAIFYLYVYFFFIPPTQKVIDLAGEHGGILQNFMRTLDILAWYLRDIILPQELIFISPMLIKKSYPAIAFSLAVVAAAVYIFIKRKKYPKEITFGSIWFLFWLFPMNNFFSTFRILIAWRYLYIPFVGFAIVLGKLFAWLWQARARFFAQAPVLRRALVVGYLGAFGIFTISSNAYWNNELVLYSYLAEIYPDSLHAHYSLGRVLLIYGNHGEAIKEFDYVLKEYSRYGQNAPLSKGDLAATYFNLGAALRQNGRYNDAIEAYREAASLFPDNPKPHIEMGVCLRLSGSYDKALEEFGKAKSMRPDFKRVDKEIELTYQAMKKDKKER